MLETVRVIMNLGKVYLARNHTSKTDMYGNNPNDNKDNSHILWLWLWPWLVENPNPYTVGWTGAFFGACLIMIQHVPTICLWSYTRNSRFIMLGIRYNHSVLFKQTFSHRYMCALCSFHLSIMYNYKREWYERIMKLVAASKCSSWLNFGLLSAPNILD